LPNTTPSAAPKSTHHDIFILEVKGGRLKRRCGVWYSVDKHDALHELPEIPFDQAATAMFALEVPLSALLRESAHTGA